MTNKDLKDKDVVIAPVGVVNTTPASLLQNAVPSGAVFAGGVPVGSAVSKKPCYLLTLEDNSGKSKTLVRFIAIDNPVYQGYFVQVKGVFTDCKEDDIVKRFAEIVQNTSKELQLEISFPVHRVCSIRSLVFNAVKPTSYNKEAR